MPTVNRDMSVVFPFAALIITVILGLLLRSVVAPLYLLVAVAFGSAATLGARAEVPGLDHNLVALGLQLPGDPLRPGPVGAGVADEEVRRLGHPPPQPATRSPAVGLPQRAKQEPIQLARGLPTDFGADVR
jgi:hypothetical protein